MRSVAVAVMGLVLGMPLAAEPVVPAQLEPLTFLLGDWEAGANTSPHGTGVGACAFALSLQDQVLVRTNHAEYPASEKGPALAHDDLMVIYVTRTGTVEAHFYDSERHLIRYAVSVPSPGRAVFVSDAEAGEPRYRLTYALGENGTLDGVFEVAPPGNPEAFARLLAWESRRASPRK